MPAAVRDIMEIMDKLAPASLAEEWDNTGLQAGSAAASTGSVLVALNVNDEVVSEALSRKCGLILSHHPLIFQPLVTVSEETAAGRLISRINREGLAVFAAHTNLDAARGGLADCLAGLLGLINVKPLKRSPANWSKLVAFVPADDLERVRMALFEAGAGVIGDYRHCSFMVEGTGTFLPEEGASPTVGEVGQDEEAAEHRVEMVFPTALASELVTALLGAHSYEEPAYDIYPLATPLAGAGHGRVGELETEAGTGLPLKEFAAHAGRALGANDVRYAGEPEKKINRVAVVPGSGGSYNTIAARQADVLVTGDLKYSDLARARDLGLALVDVPHHASEAAALKEWAPRLQKELAGPGVKVLLSEAETGFWRQAETEEKGEKKVPIAPGNDSLHHLHVDGGSRGNPGPAGVGAILKSPEGEVVGTVADFIGEATNNVAEYRALIAGVEMALKQGVNRLAIFSDSELIVRQLNGSYKVKNEGLKPYFQQAASILSKLEKYSLNSIPREDNAHADELVNEAIDRGA